MTYVPIELFYKLSPCILFSYLIAKIHLKPSIPSVGFYPFSPLQPTDSFRALLFV